MQCLVVADQVRIACKYEQLPPRRRTARGRSEERRPGAAKQRAGRVWPDLDDEGVDVEANLLKTAGVFKIFMNAIKAEGKTTQKPGACVEPRRSQLLKEHLEKKIGCP